MSTKTVLLTGARAPVTLDLARSFHQLGCRVICVDSLRKTLCTYSKCVDRFIVVSSPAENLEAFSNDLIKAIQEEGVDLVVPTCEEALYVAKIQEKLPCDVFTSSFELVERLHNKWTFAQMTREMSPKTERLKDKTIGPPYVVKPIYSRFAAHVEIIREEKELEECESNPKIAQEFVDGGSYCSYAVVKSGKVRAYSAYKVLHSIGMGAAYSMESIQNNEMETFVFNFVKAIGYTGQISFDFIKTKERLYVIECNPRATSGVHLFDCCQELGNAFFDQEVLKAPLGNIYHEPLTMVWYGMKQKEIIRKHFWKHFLAGKNIVIRAFDLGPLFFFPMVLLELMRLTIFKRKKLHRALSEDLEYNGEVSCES